MKIRFVVPGPPVACPRPRVTKHGTFYSEKYKAYRQHVRACAGAAFLGARAWNAQASAYRMSCVFYLEDKRRKDLDNLWKGLLDSMNGFAFEDDSLVTEGHLFKAVNTVRPRVEIELESL